MPDFDTRKPQESNEPNRPRIPLIANRLSRLLSASKPRILTIASTILHSLMANKLRSLLLGAILLFVIAPALVGLLIYSFGGFPHPQQEARQVDPRCWGSFAQSTENSKPGDDSNDTQIAFTRIIAGEPTASGPYATESELYVMNADGTNETRLTNTPEQYAKILATSPDWSPDGKRIAYLKGIDVDTGRTDRDIYVINADGSNQSSLATVEQSTIAWSPTDESTPDWSPDGTKIAFTSASLSGNNDVFVMNADGTCETHLTNLNYSTPGVEEDVLDWSPDGEKIAFKSASSGNDDIYVIDADGSGRANLTNTKRSEDYVAWSSARVDTITERAQEAIEDREAIDSAPQEEALQEYIKQINELRERNLRRSEEGSAVQQLAYNETQQVLGGSDPNTKEKAVRFLARAGLLPSIPINFTDLRGTDLSGANMSSVNKRRLNVPPASFGPHRRGALVREYAKAR